VPTRPPPTIATSAVLRPPRGGGESTSRPPNDVRVGAVSAVDRTRHGRLVAHPSSLALRRRRQPLTTLSLPPTFTAVDLGRALSTLRMGQHELHILECVATIWSTALSVWLAVSAATIFSHFRSLLTAIDSEKMKILMPNR
jgi:hypothetical protein